MTDNRFPVAKFAKALPFLRAPFAPELVHGIVVYTPDNDQAPCTIALYVTSETVMSLLNIVCGLNWGVRFEKVADHTIIDIPATTSFMQRLGFWLRRRLGLPFTNSEKTRHYVQVRAYVTVFRRTFEDLGEATEASAAMAEYKARAQGFKRAVRWVGVGHCLYAADRIVMWRGSGDKQLRTSETSGRPYQDERSERHIREQYEQWLKHTGKRMYGEPLDHLQAAQSMVEVTQLESPRDAKPPADAEHQGTIHPRRVSAPGMIVNPEVLQCAREAGFGAAVARQMTQLARGEEQVGQLTQPQTQTVQGWIADLSSLNVKEETVLAAIALFLERSPGREAARAKFAAWIAAKAQAALAAEAAQADARSPRRVPVAGYTPTASEQTTPPTASDQPQALPNGQPLTATFSPRTPDGAANDTPDSPQTPERLPAALEELALTIAQHGYQEDVVHRLIALSQCLGSERQIAWERLPEEKVREITRLLGCARQLGWDNARLSQMVMRAHHSAQQNTPAGRYATFDNQLTNGAATRASEVARHAA
jgi:hypothetical protein